MNRDLVNLLRTNGFNCFPIKKGAKIADHRYDAAGTIKNQEIKDDENFGYIPLEGMGTCIVDFDDEDYGDHLKQYAEKCMVIKSPHGYHLPVKGLTGNIDKVELHDYTIQDKKIIEIQGPKHYCVGPSSVLDDESIYENIGTNEILDVKQLDFHDFINSICTSFKVTGKKKASGSYANLRERFKEGLPPTAGLSNDYFQQAALVCNTEGNSRDEAIARIQKVYSDWQSSKHFSGRPWSNIEQKINEVYDEDKKIFHGGNNKSKKDTIDINEAVSNILTEYKIYSDKEIGTIYEEINGFVKIVTTSIKYRIANQLGSDIHTTNEIIFKLTANAPNLPETDDNIIVFKNGYYDIAAHSFHEHDDNHGLAVMGFEDYDFKETPNAPMFEKFMNDTFPDEQMREYAYVAASCCVVPEHQTRITMCHGEAGTGKTTFREILSKTLGEYSKEIDNNSIFNDMFGLADWENKTFISLAEAPKSVKEFDKLKRITGESTLNIRKMHTSMMSVPNRTKIIMDCNNLFKIPEDEAGPMFDRLHLLEFKERFRYTDKDVDKLSTKIAKEEGEDVISMLLQIYKSDNKYPSPKATKERWEDISIPEKSIFKKLFEYKKDSEGLSAMDIKLSMEEVYTESEVDMNVVRKLCKDSGYALTNGLYKGLTKKQNIENLEKFS